MSYLANIALTPLHITRYIASKRPLTNFTIAASYVDMMPNALFIEYAPKSLKPIGRFRAKLHNKGWNYILWHTDFADTAIELLAAEQIESRL